MKKVFLPLMMILLALPSFAQLNMQLRSNVQFPVDCNDIWGYHDEDTGIEYALVGRRDGVSIVSLEDLDNAQEVAFIPGPASTWRDLKTWKKHAYVTNETSNGVLVIDLSKLPAEAPYFEWTPDIADLGGTISSCHNLFIDERGVCYLAGCNLNSGGLIYVDVHTNEGQPEVIGWNEAIYTHDVYVRDGLIYDSQIYRGEMAIYDHTDLTKTVLLGRQQTPFAFTHNIWLSDDGNVAYTTDERANAPVAAYDVSDPTDIQALDEFRPVETIGKEVIPHNVHVWSDWLLISYYTDGGIVADASRPENIIEVGNFDTWLTSDGGFDGAWGLYPYLPSGTVLVTDIANGLYVLTPNLVRACWLEGTVTELGSGTLLSGVDISIDAAQANTGTTDGVGEYSTGIATAGTYEVTFSKAGYMAKTVAADLENGVVTILDVELESFARIMLTGNITSAVDGSPIEGALISFSNSEFNFDLTTDASGNFSTEAYPGEYDIYAGSWGYKLKDLSQTIDGMSPLTAALDFGYQDDFAVNFDWVSTSDGIASTGFWELGEPVGTFFGGGNVSNPDEDLPNDFGNQCYVTGNGGGNAGSDDVDEGIVTLTSPSMDLTSYADPIIGFSYYFFTGGGQGQSNDSLKFILNNGIEEVVAFVSADLTGSWERANLIVSDYLEVTNNVTFTIETSDFLPGHLVEAALDGFEVIENPASSTQDYLENVSLEAFPNPFGETFNFNYELENADANLLITNLLGQQIESHKLSGTTGNVQLGDNWIAGVYFAKIAQKGKQSKVLKIVKQ